MCARMNIIFVYVCVCQQSVVSTATRHRGVLPMCEAATTVSDLQMLTSVVRLVNLTATRSHTPSVRHIRVSLSKQRNRFVFWNESSLGLWCTFYSIRSVEIWDAETVWFFCLNLCTFNIMTYSESTRIRSTRLDQTTYYQHEWQDTKWNTLARHITPRHASLKKIQFCVHCLPR